LEPHLGINLHHQLFPRGGVFSKQINLISIKDPNFTLSEQLIPGPDHSLCNILLEPHNDQLLKEPYGELLIFEPHLPGDTILGELALHIPEKLDLPKLILQLLLDVLDELLLLLLLLVPHESVGDVRRNA
jgi:hypothetical protein